MPALCAEVMTDRLTVASAAFQVPVSICQADSVSCLGKANAARDLSQHNSFVSVLLVSGLGAVVLQTGSPGKSCARCQVSVVLTPGSLHHKKTVSLS